jgi:hypothetical protein
MPQVALALQTRTNVRNAMQDLLSPDMVPAPSAWPLSPVLVKVETLGLDVRIQARQNVTLATLAMR